MQAVCHVKAQDFPKPLDLHTLSALRVVSWWNVFFWLYVQMVLGNVQFIVRMAKNLRKSSV